MEGIYGNHRTLDIPLAELARTPSTSYAEPANIQEGSQRIRVITSTDSGGVLKPYERWHCPVQHPWGVPVLFPKGKRSLEAQTESSRARFMSGLCWSHTSSGS
jgi:hypothetical protein